MSFVGAHILSICTRMSSACHSYVTVCHPYVTHIYSYVIPMSLVCTRMSSVSHSYVVLPWAIFNKQRALEKESPWEPMLLNMWQVIIPLVKRYIRIQDLIKKYKKVWFSKLKFLLKPKAKTIITFYNLFGSLIRALILYLCEVWRKKIFMFHFLNRY